MSKSLNNINAQLSELYGDIVPLDTLTKHAGVTDEEIQYTIETIFENAQDLFKDTKFEFFQKKLLWNLTNAIDATLRQVRRESGDISSDLRTSIKEQDKSDIKDYELQSLNEAMEFYTETEEVLEKALETAKKDFSLYTGTAWRGYKKSDYNLHFQSASMIEASDFLKNRDRAQVLAKAPQGEIVAVIGAQPDVQLATAVLEKVHKKYENVIFAHRANPGGLDKITSFYASKNGIHCIYKKPNWKKYSKASAGFKRDDIILNLGLKGVVFFEDVYINGANREFIKKAKLAGITVQTYQSPELKKLIEEIPDYQEREAERKKLTDTRKAKFKK